MTINSLTYDNFNGFDPGTGAPNSQVHNAGEIWSSALWDMTWLLIERYGFDPDLHYGNGGNNLAMQLVIDGLKLQPANPSFLDARDGILAADVALTGGENYEIIWQAFARRGMGLSAYDGGGAPADVVVAAFDVPPPLTRVTGRVFNDTNNNQQLNTSVDTPLEGWVIYIDSNNNGVFNTGERSTVTDADGRYSLPSNGNSSFVIRQVIPSGYEVITPSSNSFTVNPNNGSIQTRNFLNKEKAGEIRGVKFNDLNGNGVRDPGEPGIAGIRIYVDLNQDGRINLLEPSGITDANGAYRILNVPAGTNLQVREAAQPGYIQTFPDPTDGGAHTDVTVTRGQVTSGLDFGNVVAFDFGDAPNSYGTLLANNGPRHGILPGFGLGFTSDPLAVVNAEPDGQPSAGANLDTSDNGVAFLSGLTPGAQSAAVLVGVRTGNNSAGFLQAWIDFNGDGDFNDPGEQIFKDLQLGTGDHTLFFSVPSNAVLGQTYARFRYGYERGIGPTGPAIAGEVEDLVTDVLQNIPVATPDVFPNRSLTPPDPFIKLNSVDNPLDVLRNDLGTTFLNPPILVNTFPLTTAAGGTVTFQGPNQPLLYTPKPGFAGPGPIRSCTR
jgi:large repetitive protein